MLSQYRHQYTLNNLVLFDAAGDSLDHVAAEGDEVLGTTVEFRQNLSSILANLGRVEELLEHETDQIEY